MFPDKPFSSSAKDMLHALKTKGESDWIRRGEERSLRFFAEAALRVPAYKNFLENNGVKPDLIKTMADFVRLPLTTKENYLLQYSLEDLSWDGDFKKEQWIISSTSGSTGEPFYFPRTAYQDEQFAFTAELCLLDFFGIDRKRTLFIDCFALGVWIGGMFMYQAIRSIMESGRYPLSMITPGADKTEALKAVKNLAPHFDQIIIGGYGPLVKDLIDDGIRMGIDWKNLDVKYFFAAEGFTEGFRDYITKNGGVKNTFVGTINHYGTADLGTMAHETPLSVLVRRRAIANVDMFESLFDEAHKEPTLAQYIPELFYFEEVDGRLVCSATGGLPLLRYDLKDRGGIRTLEEVVDKFSNAGIDILREAGQEGIGNLTWNLPFVYLYERDDLTASIYSVNIYPQSIRRALERDDLQSVLTGKFSMVVDYNEKQDQFLQLNLELKEDIGADEDTHSRALEAIIDVLSKENSEWRDFYADDGIRHKVTPLLEFWSYQHPTHFAAGKKQKWLKKNPK